jgi:7-cyano-7-deazaguanine synthase
MIHQELGNSCNGSNLSLDSPSRRSPSLRSKKLAVVLISGGMDSCVCAALAHEKHELAFLHVSYGQRTQSREHKAFLDIAGHYEVQKTLVCRFDHLSQIGGSSLTDRRIPVAKADLLQNEIPTSYVPFRNAHLLSIATSWAEVIGAQLIFIGAVGEDSTGYPDCRPEYYRVFNRLIRVGTKPKTKIRIITPVIHMRKKEIVSTGIRLGAPLQLTWSCYQDEILACGQCDSCTLRLRGFQEAGFKDPIPYAKRNKSD